VETLILTLTESAKKSTLQNFALLQS